MSSKLTNKKPKDTYQNLVQIVQGRFFDGLGNLITGSIKELYVSNSLNASGDGHIAGDLTVTGSTKFGDTADDQHSFTGSLQVQGSITGSDVYIDDWGGVSGSLASNKSVILALQDDVNVINDDVTNATASISANETNITTLTTNVNTLTGVTSSYALDSEVEHLNSVTSSYALKTEISGSNTELSSSLASRISSQESFSSSLDATYATDAQVSTAVSSLNSATSSYALKTAISGAFDISGLNDHTGSLNTFSGSIQTEVNSLQAATSSYALSTDIADYQLIVTSSSPVQNTYIIPVQVDCTPSGTTFLTGSYETASILKLNYTGGNGTHTLTLPDATTTTNTYRSIRVISNGTIDNQHQVDLIPSASQTLDGVSSGFSFNRSYEGVMVWSDGTEWFKIQAKNV